MDALLPEIVLHHVIACDVFMQWLLVCTCKSLAAVRPSAFGASSRLRAAAFFWQRHLSPSLMVHLGERGLVLLLENAPLELGESTLADLALSLEDAGLIVQMLRRWKIHLCLEPGIAATGNIDLLRMLFTPRDLSGEKHDAASLLCCALQSHSTAMVRYVRSAYGISQKLGSAVSADLGHGVGASVVMLGECLDMLWGDDPPDYPYVCYPFPEAAQWELIARRMRLPGKRSIAWMLQRSLRDCAFRHYAAPVGMWEYMRTCGALSHEFTDSEPFVRIAEAWPAITAWLANTQMTDHGSHHV